MESTNRDEISTETVWNNFKIKPLEKARITAIDKKKDRMIYSALGGSQFVKNDYLIPNQKLEFLG